MNDNEKLVHEIEVAAGFWAKYKDKLWVVIVLLFGALGGNVDRLYSAIPDVYGVSVLKKEVEDLKAKVDACPCGTARPVNDGLKVDVKVPRE